MLIAQNGYKENTQLTRPLRRVFALYKAKTWKHPHSPGLSAWLVENTDPQSPLRLAFRGSVPVPGLVVDVVRGVKELAELVAFVSPSSQRRWVDSESSRHFSFGFPPKLIKRVAHSAWNQGSEDMMD